MDSPDIEPVASRWEAGRSVKSHVFTFQMCSHLTGAFAASALSGFQVESSWNVMAHGDAREGKWRGNWLIEWVATTLHTTPELQLMRTSRLPVVDRTDAPADLNGLVRFAERRNLVFCACAITFQTQSTTWGLTDALACIFGQFLTPRR